MTQPLKLSAKFKAVLKTGDKEAIGDFVDRSSDCLCYILTCGSGPTKFHHLFARSEHKKIEEALAIFDEIDSIVREHGFEY